MVRHAAAIGNGDAILVTFGGGHVDEVALRADVPGGIVRRPMRVAVCVLSLVAAGTAAAQPLQVDGEVWDHDTSDGVEAFVRKDGMRIELAPASLPCGEQLRVAEAPRPAWLAATYWPVLDTAGPIRVLCVERMAGPATVTIKPPAGAAVGPELAPALVSVAALLSPPAVTASLGTVYSSLPVTAVRDDELEVSLGNDETARIALAPFPEGACGHDHTMAVATMGTPRDEPIAPGYYPTTFVSGKVRRGCLDTREGYMLVTVSPGGALPLLDDVLGEVRRVAYAKTGAPITSAVGSIVLPRTGQRVVGTGGAGEWKVVAGERFGVAGGDVLVSTSALGLDHTAYAIGVREGGCVPGTTEVPHAIAEPLFPSQLGRAWLDTGGGGAGSGDGRWRAWVCVAQGGATARIDVIAPPAIDSPPLGRDREPIHAMMAAIARSYGIEVPAEEGWHNSDPVDDPGYRRRRPRVLAQAALYGVVASFAPAEGDRRGGGLGGVNLRLADGDGFGWAFALDAELGYGAGELIGEMRAGAGVAAGRTVTVEAVAGAGVGSLGPAALLDVYGEVGATLPMGRGLIWLGAMHAIGVGGPDQSRVELRLSRPTARGTAGVFAGARYVMFGDSAGGMDNGSAFLFSAGVGLVAADGD
jgi:hypothetical protein